MPCANPRLPYPCYLWVFITLTTLVLAGCGAALPADAVLDGVDNDVLPASIDDQPDDDPDVDVDEPDADPVNDPPVNGNLPPSADAGSDLTVNEGDVVALDGSGSADPDGDSLTYLWTVSDSGFVVPLTASDSPSPSFVAPSIDQDTVLRFTLVVNDGESGDSDDVTVRVLADLEAAAAEPIADAGADQSVDSGSLVTLNASGSTGSGQVPLQFQWSQLTGPPVTLDGADAPLATFVAPVVTGETALVFEVTVRQSDKAAIRETAVVVRALAPPLPPPPPPPPPPSDNCPSDPLKSEPGICGCGTSDADNDGDGTMNCHDGCANDPVKTAPGVCGCGIPDRDSDADATMDCVDGCAIDPGKTAAGACGCGVADTDRDSDGTPDCLDGCPNDPTTTNPVFCLDPAASRDTDWALYMLRLVNRARSDPTGEAARIGTTVTDTRAPVPPLAYDLVVAETAKNHNDWMQDNFGNIPSGRTPDSFSHYETLDGLSGGTPAVGTPSYTGTGVGARLTAAGYPWSNYGENILTNFSSSDLVIDRLRVETSHRGWWNSSGHRSNMLNAGFTSFGFHVESRSFAAPRGGLNAPIDNLLYATQDFSRPLSNPRTHVFGVIYVDRDADGTWTPRPVGDALREGLSGVDFAVFLASSGTPLGGSTTMGNGAFSVPLADGVYHLLFVDSVIPGGQLPVLNITVAGANVDVGDFDVSP